MNENKNKNSTLFSGSEHTCHFWDWVEDHTNMAAYALKRSTLEEVLFSAAVWHRNGEECNSHIMESIRP